MNERAKIIVETLFRKADNDYKSALRLIEYEPLILDSAELVISKIDLKIYQIDSQ